MKRRTFRGQDMVIPKMQELNEVSKAPCYISQLPFELIMIIASYCAAEESYNMISVNREIRSCFLAAKTIIYKQIFCK
jgi:hypothetical protein